MKPLDPHDEALLQRHLDGLLAGEERASFEARLVREPALRAAHEHARTFHARLDRDLRAAFAPPSDLRARVARWTAGGATGVGAGPVHSAGTRRPEHATHSVRPRGGEAPRHHSPRLATRPARPRFLAAAGWLLAVGITWAAGSGGTRHLSRTVRLDGAYEAYAGVSPAALLDCEIAHPAPVEFCEGSSPAPRPSWSPAHRAEDAYPPGYGACTGFGAERATVHGFPADLLLGEGWRADAPCTSPELPGCVLLAVHGPRGAADRTDPAPSLVVARPPGAAPVGLLDADGPRLRSRRVGSWTLVELRPPDSPSCLERFVPRP